MNDGDLQKFIPKYGDRLAIVSFCKSLVIKKDQSDSLCQRRCTLLEDLKTKLKDKMNPHFTRSQKQFGNKNAKKTQKRVEIGWIDYKHDTNEYKQVYEKKGGGIKHAKLDIDMSMSSVLQLAKEWFFGTGCERPNTSYLITDSCLNPCIEETTVGQLYEQKRVKLLRLYLATKQAHDPGVTGPEGGDTEPTKPKRAKSEKAGKGKGKHIVESVKSVEPHVPRSTIKLKLQRSPSHDSEEQSYLPDIPESGCKQATETLAEKVGF